MQIFLFENLLHICSKVDENMKLVEIFVPLILSLWVFGVLFIVCDVGERMICLFGVFGEEVERCDWYRLPIEMQRMYSILLSDTQQSKCITCYGDIQCKRETSKKVHFIETF